MCINPNELEILKRILKFWTQSVLENLQQKCFHFLIIGVNIKWDFFVIRH